MSDESKETISQTLLYSVENLVEMDIFPESIMDKRRAIMSDLVTAITEAYDLPIEPEFKPSDNPEFDKLRRILLSLLVTGVASEETCVLAAEYLIIVRARHASDDTHGFTPDEPMEGEVEAPADQAAKLRLLRRGTAISESTIDAVPDEDVKRGIGDVFEHVLGRPIETKDEGRDVSLSYAEQHTFTPDDPDFREGYDKIAPYLDTAADLGKQSGETVERLIVEALEGETVRKISGGELHDRIQEMTPGELADLKEGRVVPMDVEALDDSTVEPMSDLMTLHLPDSDPDMPADAYTVVRSIGGRMAEIDERMAAVESEMSDLAKAIDADIKRLQQRLDGLARLATQTHDENIVRIIESEASNGGQ